MRKFYIHKRKSGQFYVEFVDQATGRKLSAKSTGMQTRDEAMLVVADWLKNGIPAGRIGKPRPLPVAFDLAAVLEAVKKGDFQGPEAAAILSALKERGLVVGNVAPAGPAGEGFIAFLKRAWDFDKSPFLAEKKAYGHSISRRHALESAGVVRRYWDKPEFKSVTLADVTRRMLKDHLLKLADKKLAPNTINKALATISAPLAWAARADILTVNPAQGIPRFSGATARRDILTAAEIGKLVKLKWKDQRARAAFLVGLTTGARLGEIIALQLQDVADDRLHIRHAYSVADGLKPTKTNEARDVPLLPAVRNALRALGKRNPHGMGGAGFIFYGALPDRPFDSKILVEGFIEAVHKIKIDEATRQARGLVFHSLRHNFATAMADRIDQRFAMKATGHKTGAVFQAYADHEGEDDLAKISSAIGDAFGKILPFKKGKTA